ncbi:MAG: hypothetical protein HYX40_10050 [Sphingobacteriales bacterium]|nr:hypothetical protein [Sphingobacteriales bacterium]
MQTTNAYASAPLLGKLSKVFLLLISILPVNNKVLLAQANTQPVYVAVNYMKTAPGRYNDYVDMLNTYTKKVNEAHLKSGRILGWYTHDVIMPTGSSAEYNMTIVTVTNNLNFLLDDTIPFKTRLKESFPDLGENALDNILESFGQVRTLVKREIYTFIDGLNMSGPPSKFVQVDFMKPTAGKEAEYVKLEKDIFKPIHAEFEKAGNKDDWGLYQKQMPYSDNDTYNYITANFFKNIDQMMTGDYSAAFKKVFPAMDMNKVWAQTNAARKIVKSELWRLGVYVDANNTKK